IKDISPDGSPDVNVFDIQAGVSINIFIKSNNSDTPADVHYMDVWGTRSHKYEWLQSNEVKDTDWQLLEPVAPNYFLIPTETEFQDEYQLGWSFIEIFQSYSTGFETGRDAQLINLD